MNLPDSSADVADHTGSRPLACLGQWASCPSIPTGWNLIFRDSLEGYPPKTKMPDVDVASG
jgi:hypothetical protein